MARLTGDASRRPALWESKIGGVPYHPLGTSWPQSKEDLRPLVFLAQLNLTELNPGGPATQGVVQAATGRAGSAASLVCPQRWHGVYRLQHGDRSGRTGGHLDGVSFAAAQGRAGLGRVSDLFWSAGRRPRGRASTGPGARGPARRSPDLLERAFPSSGARAVYLQPLCVKPTGAVLAPEHRAAVLNSAERAGAFVIEDDYARDLHFTGPAPPPLASQGEGRVIYLRSLTKVTAAGLRIAALIAHGPVLQCLKEARAVEDFFPMAL